MNFTLLVLGSPTSCQSGRTALRFAQAAFDSGHSIYRVFFFDDGVGVGNRLAVMPQDEPDFAGCWQQLAEDHPLDLVVCVSSALKRGVLDAGEAHRYDKAAASLSDGFEISGLGQLVDATLHSDRVITFGA